MKLLEIKNEFKLPEQVKELFLKHGFEFDREDRNITVTKFVFKKAGYYSPSKMKADLKSIGFGFEVTPGNGKSFYKARADNTQWINVSPINDGKNSRTDATFTHQHPMHLPNLHDNPKELE